MNNETSSVGLKSRNQIILAISFVLFVDALGGGFVFPILPTLLLNREYGLLNSYSILTANNLYGLSMAVFPLFSLIGIPIFGSLSDIYNRKRLIQLGLSGFLLSNLLSIIAVISHSYALFIIGRIVSALSVGTYSVAYAIITDQSTSIKDNINLYRWPTMATILGFVIGPLLGGVADIDSLGKYDLLLPFVLNAGLIIINLVLVAKLIDLNSLNKTTSADEIKSASSLYKSILNSFSNVTKYFFNTSTKYLIVSYFVLQLFFGLYAQSLSLYLSEYFNYSISRIGLFYVFIAGSILLNAVFLQKLITHYLKPETIVKLCLTLLVIVLLVQIASNHDFSFTRISSHQLKEYLVWICSFLIYMLLNLGLTAMNGILPYLVEENERGSALASTGIIYSLAWFISAFAASYMALDHEIVLLFTSVIFVIVSYVLFNQLKVIKR